MTTTCHRCGTDCSDKFELSVVGTRQAGKTHLLIMAAVEGAAMNHEYVAYVSANRSMDRVRFQDCVDRAEWLYHDQIERVYRAAGAQRITFKGGGEIRFDWDLQRKYDLCCLDDVPAERMVDAKRTIRSVLW